MNLKAFLNGIKNLLINYSHIFLPITIGAFSGFLLKNYNRRVLQESLKATSKWEYDAYLYYIDKTNSFFSLEYHSFNWFISIVSGIVTLIVVLFYKNSNIHFYLKKKFK